MAKELKGLTDFTVVAGRKGFILIPGLHSHVSTSHAEKSYAFDDIRSLTAFIACRAFTRGAYERLFGDAEEPSDG